MRRYFLLFLPLILISACDAINRSQCSQNKAWIDAYKECASMSSCKLSASDLRHKFNLERINKNWDCDKVLAHD